jgi:hypothetical protein
MKCTAHKRLSGEPCKAFAIKGRSVCRIHGGTSLQGMAAPSFKDGRYSRYLPERMVDRYRHAARDPNLLGLREDVALLDSRLADLLGRVDTGESGARWKTVKSAYSVWRKKCDTEEADVLLETLQTAIFAGYSDMEAWDAIHMVLGQREKLVASERKAMVEAQQMVSVDQAMNLVRQIVDSVRQHVSDRDALASISADVGRLITIGASGAKDTGAAG